MFNKKFPPKADPPLAEKKEDLMKYRPFIFVSNGRLTSMTIGYKTKGSKGKNAGNEIYCGTGIYYSVTLQSRSDRFDFSEAKKIIDGRFQEGLFMPLKIEPASFLNKDLGLVALLHYNSLTEQEKKYAFGLKGVPKRFHRVPVGVIPYSKEDQERFLQFFRPHFFGGLYQGNIFPKEGWRL